MVRAATHMGTCQLCGREQKLPGGRLSKHGYTVQWSMFLGTCPGADGKPFEQSVDLIEAAIARAEDTIAMLNTSATKYETEAEPDVVWVHEYRPATWQNRRSGYTWRKLEWKDIEITRDDRLPNLVGVHYTQSDGRKEKVDGSTSGWTSDLNALMRKMNAQYAASLRREAADYERYVQWQRDRIANWQPKDLKPVTAWEHKMIRDEIIIRPNEQSTTYVGAKASKLAYMRMWPTGEPGSEWIERLATNPNYEHDREHPFWFSERDGMVSLQPALLTEEHPQGDITIIFTEE